MKTLTFSTTINSPAQKVWQILWDDSTYPQWTAVFGEGSYAESDWKAGSSIKFLMPSGDGMFSKIETLIPNKKMVFQHLGSIKNGKEIPSEWEGSLETYILEEKGNKTKLIASLESTEEYVDFFQKTFPEALEKIKKLSEN